MSSEEFVSVGGWVIWSKDQTQVFFRIITYEFPAPRVQPRVPVHVFGVEIADHQDQESPAETGGQFRSDQWARRRKVSRKDFQESVGQLYLNGSNL